jgi:glycosyltransferase involved in cell wall biosynthesis
MKKQNTLVSILIINYNNEKFVSRAINSCLTQNYKNIEILIHDDKSIDDSIKKINKFKKNKKVKILINRSKKKKHFII